MKTISKEMVFIIVIPRLRKPGPPASAPSGLPQPSTVDSHLSDEGMKILNDVWHLVFRNLLNELHSLPSQCCHHLHLSDREATFLS